MELIEASLNHSSDLDREMTGSLLKVGTYIFPGCDPLLKCIKFFSTLGHEASVGH